MLLNAFKRLALLSSVLSVLTAAGCASETQNPPSSSSNTGRCGDGAVDSDEECDDGNTAPGDGCNASCKKEAAAVCGNGSKEAGEECDDGNTTPGDGCDATCKSETGPLCGDGTQDPGEQCDDGNTAPGDGCDANCKKEVGPGCGNGLIDAGEECDDGNTKDGDGCESNCIHTPVPEVVCANLAPLPQGTCEVKPGNSGRLLIGTVLAPDKILRGGQVLVDGTGVIVHVGCDCTDAADPAACTAASMSATTITCPEGVISPALLNSHDHITYAQNPPYTDTGERYEHRHDWRQGKNGHKKISSQSGASTDEVLWGELRFLLSGATSTVGSGSALGLLRNLDKTAQEGLGQKPVHFETFPLGDGSPGTQLAMGCGYPDIVTEAEIAADDAFFPHVAEGIDNFAENEFVCLSSSMNGGQDLVKPQSAFIHSIGLKATDYAAMAVDGTALIWSPRSNITLYGDTAVVTEAARLGVLVALGTDWMPTGSMNILRELRCADDFNTKRLGSYFTDRQLWQMVTSNAALASATDDVLGALAPGKVADITVFNGKTHKDFRAVIDAEAADVTLVLRGGKALYGDEAAIAGIGGSGVCDPIDVCGTTKALCLTGEIGKNFASLSTSVGAIYPAFFCGAPANEPSCTPMRPKSVDGSTVYDGSITATDKDGDNIDDMADNCPLVFNPVRPLDAGKQADFDGDGVGDACDVCPLDANTTQCTVFDPADSDGDGTPEIVDNCPGLANADQADGTATARATCVTPARPSRTRGRSRARRRFMP